MERKDKFHEVIKLRGYTSINNFMKDVEMIRDPKKGYETFMNNAKNKLYSNMIAGANGKDFSKEYIIAIEKVLNVKYIDLIDPTREIKLDINNDSLKTIAYMNDYNKTKEFALVTVNEDSILYNSDEYNKSFMDYIIEYSSDQCLKYLIDEEEIVLGFNDYMSSKLNRVYVSNTKDYPINVARILCNADDVESFNKVFNTFIVMDWFEGMKTYHNEEFIEMILNTNRILNSLFELKDLDIHELNRGVQFNFDFNTGLFINPILNEVLKYAIKHHDKYKSQLDNILNHSIENNEKIVNFYSQSNQSFKIDDYGKVMIYHVICGQAVKYDYPVDPKLSYFSRKQIEKLNDTLLSLEAKESSAYGRKKYLVKDDRLFVTSSDNNIEYEMLQYMNDKEFSYIPKLILHDKEKKIDEFEYKKTFGESFPTNYDEVKIASIATFLKQFHKLAEEKLGKGNVYLHNHLALDVCSTDMKLVTKWDRCSIGNPIDDILYVLVEWSNMLNRNRFNQDVMKSIKVFVDTYELDGQIKLGNELEKYLNDCLESLDANDKDYVELYENIGFALLFIKIYKQKLNDRDFTI